MFNFQLLIPQKNVFLPFPTIISKAEPASVKTDDNKTPRTRAAGKKMNILYTIYQ